MDLNDDNVICDNVKYLLYIKYILIHIELNR
jgi:hypothetical protein